jgi:hypothetical protein
MIVILLVIVIMGLAVVAYGAFAGWFGGDNDRSYVPPDNKPIIGYVDASAVIELDNRELFGSAVTRFQEDGLSAELVSVPTGLSTTSMFDVWSHDFTGTVKFRLINVALSYDTGYQQASWAGHVGGGALTTLSIQWPAGPAITTHGTYTLTAKLYSAENTLMDEITALIYL